MTSLTSKGGVAGRGIYSVGLLAGALGTTGAAELFSRLDEPFSLRRFLITVGDFLRSDAAPCSSVVSSSRLRSVVRPARSSSIEDVLCFEGLPLFPGVFKRLVDLRFGTYGIEKIHLDHFLLILYWVAKFGNKFNL